MTEALLGALVALALVAVCRKDKSETPTPEPLPDVPPQNFYNPLPPVIYSNSQVRLEPPNVLETGEFRRIGTLTGEVDGKKQVLPLYSRPSLVHRDRFHYFTNTGGLNPQPAAIVQGARDCLNDPVGCNEIFADDFVNVKSFDKTEFEPYLFANA